MILSDKTIIDKLSKGLLLNLGIDETGKVNNITDTDVENNVHNITYDLSTSSFYVKSVAEKGVKNYTLKPLDSVFVASEEFINLDGMDIVGEVKLKYSHMTEGLLLDAPLYQPGHTGTNIFFRLTNISNKDIELDATTKYAYILFHATEVISKQYDGDYNNNNKKSLDKILKSSYMGVYGDIEKDLDKTRKKMKNTEKTIYGNVLVIITVFVTLFSLLSTFMQQNGTILSNTPMILLILGSCLLLIAAVCCVIATDESDYFKSLFIAVLAVILINCSLAYSKDEEQTPDTQLTNTSQIIEASYVSHQSPELIEMG